MSVMKQEFVCVSVSPLLGLLAGFQTLFWSHDMHWRRGHFLPALFFSAVLFPFSTVFFVLLVAVVVVLLIVTHFRAP